VRQQRLLVGRGEDVAGAERLVGVARRLGDDAGAFARLAQPRPDLRGGDRPIGPVGPGHGQRIQSLLGGPRVVADHRHQIIQRYDLADARDGERLGLVEARDLAAAHRALGEDGELHPGRHGVDPIDGAAVHLVGRVEPLERPADHPERLGILQRRILRQRQASRRRDELAITGLAAARLVKDAAVLRAALGCGDAPALRGGFDQSRARGGAGLAQGRPEGADGVGIAGGLHSQQGVGIELLVGRGVLEPHHPPSRVELLGEDHGNRGVGALPHLHLGHDQGDEAVGIEADEGVRREARPLGARSRHRNVQRDQQSRRARRADQAAARHPCGGAPPPRCGCAEPHGRHAAAAAFLIAWRIRT